MDYIQYLVRDTTEFDNLKQELGDKFNIYYSNVVKFIENLPSNGMWISFLTNVPEKNKKYLIKIICYYICVNWDPNEIIEFNNNVTQIRRKCFTPSEKGITYAEYKQEIQNKCSNSA